MNGEIVMRKTILLATLFILLVGTAYGELYANAESVENSIYLDELAEFNIFVNNTDSYQKNLNIYTADIKWYIDIEPSPPQIPGDTVKKFNIKIQPSAWAETGSQIVKIMVESPNTDEKVTLQTPVYVKSYDDPSKEYRPSVELRVDFPEEVDPREPIPLEMYFRNRNRLDIQGMEIEISSSLVTDTKQFNLGPMSETRERIQYSISPGTKPMQDTIELTLSYENKTINKERINYEVIAYSEFVDSEDNIQELFKKTTDYTITNEGNIKKKGEYRIEMTVLQNLFSKTDPKPDEVNLRSQYLEWNLDLQPDEQIQIRIIRNYRPALYLLLISIVVVMVYFLYRSPVLIRKESIVIGSTEQGISEMKVLLHLRNRSPDLIEDLTLTDLIPPIADLVKQEHLGTIAPSKILKHHKKGTIIKWEFEVLEPFEERIISYKIKTRMTIVGGVTLPKAKIKFLKKDTERVVKSNKSQVNLGL